MAQFIGDLEIDKIEGNKVYYKPLSDGSTPAAEEFAASMLNRIVTDEPLDASSLRDKRCFMVAAKILQVLFEENIYLDEVDYVLRRVIWSMQENEKLADEKIWGFPTGKRTMALLNKILVDSKAE